MKKLSIAPYMVAIAIILTINTVAALAQRRVNPNRVPQGQRQLDPQFGGRRDPSPLGNPQLGRQPNPNLARKQELRRRLMQAIGLTPEQHQRMQDIRRGHEDESISTGRRLRQARQSLDRAIMSEPYNEAAVRQATEELAAAQADKIRLESRIRAQVRGVLTSDQVIRFHQLERRIRREMRQQQQEREQMQQGLNVPEQRMPIMPEDVDDLVGLLLFVPLQN
jgi:Spy/CpxP family protein refolding chaperone